MNDLVADERRLDGAETGIPVRARTEKGWDAVDIAHLTRESLWQWLTSKSPDYCRSVVLALLGHDHHTDVSNLPRGGDGP